MLEKLRKTPDGKVFRLCREYTDVNGNRRTAIFIEEGPAGDRWLFDDGAILTVDMVERTHYKPFRGKLYAYAKRPWNPWDAAKDIKDTWVEEIEDGKEDQNDEATREAERAT